MTFTHDGTTSTYDLFNDPTRDVRGLVVYLDGDGMYAQGHPDQPPLGGADGVIAQAAQHGYATLTVATPDTATRTFWRDSTRNGSYIAALIANTRNDLGLQASPLWLVGYSGGAQLISQTLLPNHPEVMSHGGGALLIGGGGAPDAPPPAPSASFPLIWRVGTADDGSTSSDGYDAKADASKGEAAWRQAGAATQVDSVEGADHGDIVRDAGAALGVRLER